MAPKCPPAVAAMPDRPRPLRRYGQNHLVDTNVLRLIVEQAAVGPDDVVLEVGPAAGLLTRPLLERAATVHAVEIDRRFVPGLERLAGTDPRLRLHVGDALRLDLVALDPPPTALVANLPYNIAIPVVMTTIAGLPTLRRWAVMVQRELGDRLFAAPGTKAYAAVSVLAQLACVQERARPVPRSAFRPRPNVESVFLTFVRRPSAEDGSWELDGERLGGEDYAAMVRLVRHAFGQRRKQLGTSLPGLGYAREAVREALDGLGLPSVARPEELSPVLWVRFARSLGALPGPTSDLTGGPA
jgi:16S rRNA (adenine1518-N6/adenine1519-N6)-dimethyltransferase